MSRINSLTSQELMQLLNHNEKQKQEGMDKTAKVIEDKVDLKDALGMDIIGSMVETYAVQFKKEEMKRFVATHHAHIKEVHANQSRLRENIKCMENVSSSKPVRYLADLDEEDDNLIHARQVITALEEQMAALVREVERLDTIGEVEVNLLLKL